MVYTIAYREDHQKPTFVVDVTRQMARKLDAMRAALLELAGRCTGGDRPDCPIIDELSSG